MTAVAVSSRAAPSLEWAYVLARIGLALLFLWSGYGKLMDVSSTASYMAKAGMPMPEVLVWPAVLIELIAGAMLVVGFKVRWAAVALIVYTIIATFYFHAFWAIPADQMRMQQIQFMKNIAIIGGLLAVLAHGSGRYAIDRAS